MRIEGTLAKWNDERGFGFISPVKGGNPDVFVHVSALPKGGQRPFIGELITFEIETDKDGKKRATKLLFPNRLIHLPIQQPEPSGRRENSRFAERMVLLAVVVALAAYGYEEYAQRFAAQENVAAPKEAVAVPPEAVAAPQEPVAAPQKSVAVHSNKNAVSPTFKCDGRTYCSQMTSCAEATFFLKNCPNVKMDGNHDGIACERQWCN